MILSRLPRWPWVAVPVVAVAFTLLFVLVVLETAPVVDDAEVPVTVFVAPASVAVAPAVVVDAPTVADTCPLDARDPAA